MGTSTHTTPPDATSATVGDVSITVGDVSMLRDLLRRRQALFPALRRDDCPPETLGEYLAVCRAILHFQSRISVARFRAIKAEVTHELG